MFKLKYWLLVRVLRVAKRLAVSACGNYAPGLLADAEGDSGYWRVRRPPTP